VSPRPAVDLIGATIRAEENAPNLGTPVRIAAVQPEGSIPMLTTRGTAVDTTSG
jgi:hypothetical protein